MYPIYVYIEGNRNIYLILASDVTYFLKEGNILMELNKMLPQHVKTNRTATDRRSCDMFL